MQHRERKASKKTRAKQRKGARSAIPAMITRAGKAILAFFQGAAVKQFQKELMLLAKACAIAIMGAELTLRGLYGAEVVLVGALLWHLYKTRPTATAALACYLAALALYYVVPLFAEQPAPIGAVWGQMGRALLYLLMSASALSAALMLHGAPPLVTAIAPAVAWVLLAAVVLIGGEAQLHITAHGVSLCGFLSAGFFCWVIRTRLTRGEQIACAIYVFAQLLHPLTLFSGDLAVNNAYFALMLLKFLPIARAVEGDSKDPRRVDPPADEPTVFPSQMLSVA
jgi:hypothetical protein